MPQPFLQFEQAHRVFGVEQLRGDGGTRSVARDSTAQIVLWNTCLPAQFWKETQIQIGDPDLSHLVEEQKIHHLPRLGVAQLSLGRSNLFPCIDRLADHLIDRLRESCASLVHWNIEKAD